jgi:hypothetical protein
MFPADPDLRTPLRTFLLKFLRAAPALRRPRLLASAILPRCNFHP